MTVISILTSSEQHPIYPWLQNWIEKQRSLEIELVSHSSKLREFGDFLFLISCSEIIKKELRSRFTHTLVVHASDLPKGRGWSPHIWEIESGVNTLTVSLLEAEDKVDTGKIWTKEKIHLDGTELYDEINDLLFSSELRLMEQAIYNKSNLNIQTQQELESATFYEKRTPKNSEIFTNKTIADQFDLLRVCDAERFPAYFEHRGCKYTIRIDKAKD